MKASRFLLFESEPASHTLAFVSPCTDQRRPRTVRKADHTVSASAVTMPNTINLSAPSSDFSISVAALEQLEMIPKILPWPVDHP